VNIQICLYPGQGKSVITCRHLNGTSAKLKGQTHVGGLTADDGLLHKVATLTALLPVTPVYGWK